jgi:hypothetical protein
VRSRQPNPPETFDIVLACLFIGAGLAWLFWGGGW